MIPTIKVTDNFGALKAAQLSAFATQRKAAALALNDTAFDGAKALNQRITERFDRPTALIAKSAIVPSYTKATPDNLRVLVKINDKVYNRAGYSPASVLLADYKGGDRRMKSFEKLLMARGIMPQGTFAVPGTGAEIDANGNMSTKQIREVLGYFQAYQGSDAKKNATDKRIASNRKGTINRLGFTFFFLKEEKNGLLPGIYKRIKRVAGFQIPLKVIMVFLPRARYDAKRLDFDGVMRDVTAAKFPRNMAYWSQRLASKGTSGGL